MVSPISSLMNMEMLLYGGLGTNANAPSYLNGYCGGNNYYTNYINPYNYGYGNSNVTPNTNNVSFKQAVPYGYGTTNQQSQQVATDSVFQGLSQAEQKALLNDHTKSLAHTQTFKDAALSGGVGFALMNNPRLIFHPINTFKATFSAVNSTNKAFADLTKEGTKLHQLWAGTGKNAAEMAAKNSDILREAWLQHNKAVSRCNGKLGWIRRSYKATGDVKVVEGIVKNLEAALKAGDMKLITEYTAQLKHIYGSNPGFLAKTVNWFKGLFGCNVGPTSVSAALADKAGIEGVKAGLESATKMTGFKELLTHGGWMGPLTWIGFEFLFDFGKLKTAFQKDNETGMKQLGQTTVKGLGAAVGWTAGEATAKWAFAKYGAKIGTKLGGLWGTLIGGIVGVTGGSIGMWLTGNATRKIIGQDVADKVETAKLAKTQEGQVQLLQTTLQRMQKGENVSPEAQMAVQKLMAQYA